VAGCIQSGANVSGSNAPEIESSGNRKKLSSEANAFSSLSASLLIRPHPRNREEAGPCPAGYLSQRARVALRRRFGTRWSRASGTGRLYACPATTYLEELRDVLRDEALALHAGSEARVVEVAGSHGADAVQHLLLAVGEVAEKPAFEERSNGAGKPHGDEAGEGRPGIGGGREQVGQLVIGEPG
jgi:hypothetical protein